MLWVWAFTCFLLLHFYCACLGLAVVFLPPALIVALAVRARGAGHELFVALVRLGWSPVLWECLESVGRLESEPIEEEEWDREEESWRRYDETFDNFTCG